MSDNIQTKKIDNEIAYQVEIVKFYLYDVGRSIDLGKAAFLLPGIPGMRPARRRDTPDSISIPAPLCIDLRSVNKSSYIADNINDFSASARLYDEGVMSIIARMKVSATLKDLHGIETQAVSRSIKNVDSYVQSQKESIVEQLASAIKGLEAISEQEQYTAYCFSDVGEEPVNFINNNRTAMTTLLLGETWEYPVHYSQVNNALKNPFIYSNDDLAIFDIDNCIIIDKERDYEDVLIICELANYQFLELRVLDKLLDKWLDIAEVDVSSLTAKQKKLKFGSLNRKLKNIQSLRLEALFILENLENSSKIIGDFFLGQIYENLCNMFNTSGWTRSVERRIDALQNMYEIVRTDKSERATLQLDIVFILVCIILPVIQILQVMLTQ